MKYTYWPITTTFPYVECFYTNTPPMDEYLKKTRLLNYTHPCLNDLVERQGWLNLSKQQRIDNIFSFIKNEIVFGYNKVDDIPASRVLHDGYGCGVSKSILLMALLRKCHIPCRFHAVTIDKELHKRTISGLAFHLAPRNFVHSWVEVYVESKWIKIVGYILDHVYLQGTYKQNTYAVAEDTFFNHKIATSVAKYPLLEHQYSGLHSQKQGINCDYGVFNTPDDFYTKYASELGFVKNWLFRNLAQNQVNNKLSKIRHDHDDAQDLITASRVGYVVEGSAKHLKVAGD